MPEPVVPEYEAPSEKEMEVFRWRKRQLLMMGFGAAEARLLAETPGIELEQVRRLREKGCTTRQVLAIVL